MKNMFSREGDDDNEPKEKISADTKKKRDEFLVDIRKKKRTELLNKKRNINSGMEQRLQESGGSLFGGNLSQENEQLREFINECLKKSYEMKDFVDLIHKINSENRFEQHYGLIGLRKILSIEQGPPIQPVIDANLVPKLISFMQNESEPHLQLEAAWALTNVASGTTAQTQTIIDKGGIPQFIRLLDSKRPEVAEQAIWAIGNIAGDSPNFRNLVLKLGGLEPLLRIIENTDNKNTVKHGTWALSNLCRGRPLPEFHLVEKAIPTLARVIKTESEAEVLTDASWAMSYLSDGNTERIYKVTNTGIVPALIKHLGNPFLSILIPVLRTLGNIVTGDENQTNLVLENHGVIGKLFELLNHEKKAVRRETAWTLSNITAGTPEQIEEVIGHSSNITFLINLAEKDAPEVKREAAWVLSNATKHGIPEQIHKLLQAGLIPCFTNLLTEPDNKTLIVVLEGINNILDMGAKIAIETKTSNPVLEELEREGAIPRIESLQEHPNNDIYQRALKILENHFEIEDVI